MLKNGRYLLADNGVDPSADRMMNTLTLVSSSLEKVRELDRKEYPNPVTSAVWQTEFPLVLWAVARTGSPPAIKAPNTGFTSMTWTGTSK